MFRIFINTALSLLLLISTIGLVVSTHYCGGEMVGISVFQEEEPCCDMDGCCHNETHTYQVKNDFSTPAIATIPVLAELDILNHDLLFIEGLFAEPESDNTTFIDFSSPPKNIQNVLSLKQVYLL